MPSKVLGLHLECGGLDLRLHDLYTAGLGLPSPPEVKAAREQAEAEIARPRQQLDALRQNRLGQHRWRP